MLALDDLQFVLHIALAEERTLEERDEPVKRQLKVLARNVEVEVGVLRGRIRVGAAATLACADRRQMMTTNCIESVSVIPKYSL